MKVRDKAGNTGSAGKFNMHALAEVVVYYDGDDGRVDSVFLHDLDVQLPDGAWKHYYKAIEDRDIITDNYNTHFFYPPTEEDRKRGYTL